MINFYFENLYIIVLGTIFFYSLFQGYLSIHNINNLLDSYTWIGTALKLLAWLSFICLLLYLFCDTVYAKAPKECGDFTEPEVKVTTGDVSNSVHKDCNTHIPNKVATGLTNLGTGAAVAAGLKGGASIAKASGLSPAAKIGVMAVGVIIGGSTITVTNAIGGYLSK